MTTALEFLESVLPEAGYKCATIIEEHVQFNRFFNSTRDLCDFILAQDALGKTVYHACATYAVPQSDPRGTPRNQRVLGRTKTNTVGAKALWADVDCGEDKPYATPADAAVAVQNFCRAAALPPPIYVGSGYGLHIYWPLAEMLDRATWERYSLGLKDACLRLGLEIGRERTADIASILRTPGTHNRKRGNAERVRAGQLVGPYTIELFAKLLEGETHEANAQLPALRSPAQQRQPRGPGPASGSVPQPLTAAAANIYADEPRWTEPVTRGCRQVADLAIHRGRINEPRWYAALGVLAACVDGERYGHHWSSGYAGYTYAETQARLDRSKEFGPTTCQKFESLHPKGCEGCPFRGKITSPIQLGRQPSQSRSAPASNERSPLFGEAARPGVHYPTPPEGFALGDGGLHLVHADKNGTPVHVLVSKHPLYVNSVQTNEADGGFSIAFKLKLPHEPIRDIIVPSKAFFSASGLSELAGSGAIIHDSDSFKKYVREAVDVWNDNHNLERRYDQFGWKDDDTSFLFGANLYTPTEIKAVAGSDEVQMRSQYLGPRRLGSLGAWSNAANKLFAKGHEVQGFALLASFAAPLMRFHSSGEGGAIVSLVSDKSGTGKTTALEAAASVWGRLKGTQIIDDDTTVAKGLKLGVFGNIACTYDELYNRDPDVIRRFVLMFTNGRDKDRGTSDGTLRHVRSEWQTILLLASNNSIVDILSSMDGTDAPAYRILEFIMDTPKDLAGQRGDQLKQQLDNNSGYAADLYLRTLVQPATLNYIKAALPKWTDQVWQRTGLDKEHRFWVRTIASVIAAGTLVKHANILDFSIDRMAGWAIEQVQGKKITQEEVANTRTSISAMVAFLDTHLLDTLVVQKAFRPGPGGASPPLVQPKRNMHIRYELETQKAFVEENVLKKWLVKMGINSDGFYHELKQKGVLLARGRRMTLGAGTPMASGQSVVVELDCGHPAMSGSLRIVDNIVVQPVKRELTPRIK